MKESAPSSLEDRAASGSLSPTLFSPKGARVAISGRRADILAAAVASLQGNGISVHGISADVRTAEGRATTIREALDQLGGLDILVNNAGGVRAGRLEKTAETELQAMVDVALAAPIMLTRSTLPALRAAGSGVAVAGYRHL